jgi:FHS family L-fucose permease-like MFS transporter
MSVATTLFFMVGALTCLNDIIIPHLKSFFSAYFFFSYPASRVVDWIDYKRTMVCGLLIMGLGAAMFIPAARLASFPLFLLALITLAAGMTFVQVAVNPYVAMIGPSATASSRLNLAQAFNSVGTFIAPFLGGLLILGHAIQLTGAQRHALNPLQLEAYLEQQAHSVQLPYAVISATLVLLAILLGAIRLRPQTENIIGTTSIDSIWGHPRVVLGAIGLFVYVGAEVTIGSLLVNYMGLPQIAGLREQVAANYLTFYWGGAMIGRFIGSAVLQRVRTERALAMAALTACALVSISVLTHGNTAMYALLLVGFCNSIMFPSIFTLGIQDLGPLTSKGSSMLMAAAGLGGAVLPIMTGKFADRFGLQPAFLLPAVCYIYIAGFGVLSRQPRTNALDLALENG